MSQINKAIAFAIPDYAADILTRKYAHTNEQKVATERSRQRTYRLIAEALKDMPPPRTAWAIANTDYGNTNDEEIGYEEDDVRAYIYGQERGNRGLEAVFASGYSGANYFVWVVSNGTRKIDWSLFGEMLEEPSFLGRLFGKK